MSNRRQQEKQDIDKQIALLRMKQKIAQLDGAEGHGTSMITLYVPPGQLVRATKTLVEELSVATNIKSRV